MVVPPRSGLAATGRRDLANRARVASRCRATIGSQAAAAPSSYCSISTPVVVVSWPARYGGARAGGVTRWWEHGVGAQVGSSRAWRRTAAEPTRRLAGRPYNQAAGREQRGMG